MNVNGIAFLQGFCTRCVDYGRSLVKKRSSLYMTIMLSDLAAPFRLS